MSAYPCQNGVIWSLRKPEDPPQAPMMSVTSNITSRMPASQFQPTWWPWCASVQFTCEVVNRERVHRWCWRHVRSQNFTSASKWQNLVLKCDHLALTLTSQLCVGWEYLGLNLTQGLFGVIRYCLFIICGFYLSLCHYYMGGPMGHHSSHLGEMPQRDSCPHTSEQVRVLEIILVHTQVRLGNEHRWFC